jgi:hypothetical protein
MKSDEVGKAYKLKVTNKVESPLTKWWDFGYMKEAQASDEWIPFFPLNPKIYPKPIISLKLHVISTPITSIKLSASSVFDIWAYN